ncbi:SAV_915 family protein [Streptomyces sp. NPDC047860]|uniref:SAV_915 family protein n=1 Tax=Streptomyces sp. NPDC047860 TaxID=3155743 RepID=UPI003406774A
MPESKPEYLVLPTMNGSPLADDTVEATLVPIADEGGRQQLVALAFTSVSLLVEAIGEEQPWVVLPAHEIDEALMGSGAESVLVDPRLFADAEPGIL